MALIAALALGGILATPVHAGALAVLVRRAARVADDVPIGEIDDVTARLARSGLSRDALEVELRRGGRLADRADDAARAAVRSTEATRLLRRATDGLEPGMVRALDGLDQATRESAAILVRGGERLGTAVPDLAARGQLLRAGGTETVAAVGLYGEEALDSALRLDAAFRAGTLVRPVGLRPVSLRDFGRVMVDHGQAAHRFWGRFITPHWKVWLASGALAAYLVAPEKFMDAFGNLTESGMQKLTDLAGQAAAAAIRGTTAGMQDVVAQMSGTASGRALDRRMRIAGAALVLILGLAWPRSRALLMWPGRLLLQRLTPSTKSAKPQPFGDNV